MWRHTRSALLVVASVVLWGNAHANLTQAGVFTGNVGLSVDGAGTNAASGTIQAAVPVGATIRQAFLYAAGLPSPYFAFAPTTLGAYNAVGITLQGNAIRNFDTLVGATSPRSDIGRWYTGRADVTALVTALVAGAVSPNFAWAVTEGNLTDGIDGLVLAIVYEQAGLPMASVVLLDGGQDPFGDTSIVTFASPLGDVSPPSFQASLGLGISFSCCSTPENPQRSTVDVNGSRLTDFAGNFNDGDAEVDGALITVGGLGDDPGNNVASYEQDDELYDLKPFLSTGDTGFTLFTTSPRTATSGADDNIFFASVYVTGPTGTPPVAPIPEPETYALMLTGLALLGVGARRRKARRGT